MVATMVGVVVPATASAAVDAPAHLGSATRADTVHRPIVGGAQMPSVRMGVARPMRTEQLCEGESHADVP